MADLVFRDTPWTPDPAHPGVVTIKDSWPQWQKDVWTSMLRSAGFTVPPTLWKPVYQPADKLTVTNPNGTGTATQQLNQQFFVTKESAEHLAAMFGATVREKPPEMEGGVEFVLAGVVEYWLGWNDSALQVFYELNAGAFAYYFCPAQDPVTGGPGVPSAATLQRPSVAVDLCLKAKESARLDVLRRVR